MVSVPCAIEKESTSVASIGFRVALAIETSRQESEATAPVEGPRAPASLRSLLLVAGSGRSGTSLFTGILQRLGFYVPQPEVPADETNLRGFAESKWVVQFHTRLLADAGVQMADARPAAWADTAEVALDGGVARELRGWLKKQFGESNDLVIKDPRLSWFLPLWRRCGDDLGVPPRYVTVLRHPAAVVQSKLRSYGTWQGDISRTAGWINQTLFTERATRGQTRVFVRHDKLLEDWTRTVGRVGEVLDLAVIRDAPAAATVRAHEFVDRSLTQARAGWGDFEIPDSLRELADEVWVLVSRLASDEPDSEAVIDGLEAARAAYTELYENAEAIAQSSIAARRRRSGRKGPISTRAVRFAAGVVPNRYKRKVPPRLRAKLVAALRQSGASRR
jgi:hypothetical protein